MPNIISRLELDHPILGETGGVSLYNKVQALYQKIGDNMGSRFFTQTSLANAASVDFEHNFKDTFADLRWDLYLLGGGGALTHITANTSPSLADFAVVATPSFLTTKIRVTNNSGSTRDIAMIVMQDPILLGELQDVDLVSVPPVVGNTLVYDDITKLWKPGAAGGSGSGGVNYNPNPDAAFNANGYTGTGTATATRSIASGDLPRKNFANSALQLAVGAVNDYVRLRLSIGAADKAKQLFLSWAQRPESGYAAGDWEIHIYSADSGYTTFNEIILPYNAIPAGDGEIKLPITTTTADNYEVRWVRKVGSKKLNLVNIIFGPDEPSVVPTVTAWERFTPVFSDAIITTPAFFKRIVGECLEIQGFGKFTGGGAASVFWLEMPDNLTMDLYDAALGSGTIFGEAVYYQVANGLFFGFTSWDGTSPANKLILMTSYNLSAVGGQRYGGLFANSVNANDQFYMTAKVKCVELSAQGALSSNTSVEYASNSDATSTDNETAFAYGPQGSVIPAVAAAGTYNDKRVRFKTAVLPTDVLMLQVQDTVNQGWVNLDSVFGAPSSVGGVVKGAAMVNFAGPNTDVRINWGGDGYSGSPGRVAAADWTGPNGSGFRWRVVKCSNPLGIGAAIVTQTSSGLVDRAGQLLGTNTNDDAVAGNVGEYISAPGISVAATGTANIASFALPAGNWEVGGGALVSGGTNVTSIVVGTSLVTNSYDTGGAEGNTIQILTGGATFGNNHTVITPVRRIKLSAPGTLYLVGSATASVAPNFTTDSFLWAKRIR